MNEERGKPSHLDSLIASGHLPDPAKPKRSLVAQKIEAPPSLVQQMGNAMLIECWRIGNTAAVVSRENIADATDTPNYRWHLSIAHPERKPTDAEFALAMEKFDLAAGDCCIKVSDDDKQIDVWQLDDAALSRHWHFL